MAEIQPTPAMPLVSHVRSGAVVLRWRASGDVAAETHTHDGACHPGRDSASCAFYERAWSGADIEPAGRRSERLRRTRPRDVNLRRVAGAERWGLDGTERPPRPNARAATMPSIHRRHR